MATQAKDSNTLMNIWLDYQSVFNKQQEQLFPKLDPSTKMTMDETMKAARDNWSAWEKQAADWLKAADNWLPADMQKDGGNTLIAESLKRMLDPKYFSFAALDEAIGSVQRMAEGPELADIGVFEKHMLESTSQWLAMREADARYMEITGSAWSRAFQKYSSEISSDWSTLANAPRKALDRWLEIANDELIRTQRQDDFLDASRKLFRSTIEFRIKHRELSEIWCESQSIPTRTEVDDLHRSVTQMRREIRALKRQLAEKNIATGKRPASSTQHSKAAASKKKAAERTASKKKVVGRTGSKRKATGQTASKKKAARRTISKKKAAARTSSKHS